ncbi:MAG: tetratricopeptide repeat protein [Bdellovibrionales bacterium]
MEKYILKSYKKILLGSILMFSFGCSTVPLEVGSEPDQAEVFIVDSKGVEKSLGLTPLRKTKKEMENYLTEHSPGELVNFVIKKDGFKKKDIWIPLNAGGSLGTQLNLTLTGTTSSSEELQTARQVIDQLFRSQQYARTEQLERALIEIDKVLEKFPQFERAMTMKAAILYGKGQFKDSLKWYEDALVVNPELKSAVEMAGKIRRTLKMPLRVPASKSTKKATGKIK